MSDDILKRMQEDAKLCNARLRKVIGNYSPAQNSEQAKASAAKGGRASHKNGSKKGKNGIQGLMK